MNVALHAVDSKIPNVALMKLSTWHKQQGHSVKLYEPLFDTPDVLYLSKQFDYTPDFLHLPDCEIIRGGTGYDLNVKLPCDDTVYPDYDLFGCDYAIGRITRGCPRACERCIVSKQDGTRLRQVAELTDFWRGQKVVRLLDDNIAARFGIFYGTMLELYKAKVRVYIDSLDARHISKEAVDILLMLKPVSQWRFSFDQTSQEESIRDVIGWFKAGGFPLRKITVYVLIGYNTTPEEDYYRVELLRGLGVSPFVMPYNRQDPYQKSYARYVNAKAVFRSVSWADYDAKKARE